MNRSLTSACLAFVLLVSIPERWLWASESDSAGPEWEFDGHSKLQGIYTHIPGDSVLQEISGDSLEDYSLEVRLKAAVHRDRWDFRTHLQFISVRSDTLSVSDDLPLLIFPGAGLINDDRRWFDLTHVFHNKGRDATLVRLDRLSIGYTGEQTVFRFGRQAVSWGSGLLYTPMDIFNPFDPSAVDKEYKSGDDMLYGQYLFNDGGDIQTVAVVRRNLVTGDVEAEQSSLAIKYHGFAQNIEYDLLLAEHYDELVVGLGGSTDLAGAVWRGDLVWTKTDSIISSVSQSTLRRKTDYIFSTVAGVSYSWIAGERNWTGALEYYYNGFGQPDGDYSVAVLATNPELLKRLARGEVFNLGRHYLGVSASLELTPLLILGPNLFVNLTDPSALAQLVINYDWKQDLQILAALNVPVGSNGSEYGGIESGQPGLYISSGVSLFAQLAWYF